MAALANEYLAIEVKTASPQKLQLMLIDGAMRNVQLGKQLCIARQPQAAQERISHAQKILAQLLAGINFDEPSPLAHRVAGIYSFLLRSLAQWQLHQENRVLDDVTRVLEIERGTWQEVCRTIGVHSSETANPPHFRPISAADPLVEGLSIEA